MVFSKNLELAALRQQGFLNEKNIDFLNAFFLRRKYTLFRLVMLHNNMRLIELSLVGEVALILHEKNVYGRKSGTDPL